MRQTNLFAGPRQRGRQAPPPFEFATHVMVADTLRRWARPDWLWTHPGTGEKRPVSTAARLKRMGLQKAWPDFILVGPGATLHGLELKRRGEKPSSEQAAWGAALIALGGRWEWTDSYKQAVTILQSWGVLPETIEVQ
jgi:hypothetical protein